MAIIDRSKELKRLKKKLDMRDKEFFVLYGRRRLGKTTLMREACADIRRLFFACPQASESESLRLFQATLAECFDEPLLRQSQFSSWADAITYAFKSCSAQKVPMVFDEFPYLMRSVPGIDSILQHAWDHHEGPLWIALCGSILSVMENNILGHSAPLYGRRTEQMELMPMTFAAVSDFFPKLSFEEKAKMFSFFGGVPAYANRAAGFTNADEAVTELIFSTDGILYQEPEFLLREELREPSLYFSLLHALSAGCTRPNEISQRAGIPSNSLGKYLDTLRRMRLVEKKAPITERNSERSTKGIYRIADPFLRFWFRFVFPNRSIIELGKGSNLWNKLKADYPSYLGMVYEDIAREQLAEHCEEWLGWVPSRMGSFWEPQIEIDIVVEALDEPRVAFFECKWTNQVSVEKQLAILQKKAAGIPAYKSFEHEYYIISRTQTSAKGHIFLG